MESVRLDRWLCAARIFKSRALATEACNGGRVLLNDARAKASHRLSAGDELRVQKPRKRSVLRVRALAEKRLSPAAARELYEDHSPPPPPKEERHAFSPRPRGAGRPTKRDSRLLRKLRGR